MLSSSDGRGRAWTAHRRTQGSTAARHGSSLCPCPCLHNPPPPPTSMPKRIMLFRSGMVSSFSATGGRYMENLVLGHTPTARDVSSSLHVAPRPVSRGQEQREREVA